MATIGGDVTEQIKRGWSILIDNAAKCNREWIQPQICSASNNPTRYGHLIYGLKCKWPILGPEQLAPACYWQDHQSGRNKYRREHSGSNKFDSALDVSRHWAEVQRSKCRRHKPALPVSLSVGRSAQLLQGGARNSPPKRGMDERH